MRAGGLEMPIIRTLPDSNNFSELAKFVKVPLNVMKLSVICVYIIFIEYKRLCDFWFVL